MSLQRLVMLTAIGHHNRQSSNNNHSNIINGTHNTMTTVTAGMMATATPLPTLTSSSSAPPPLTATATSVTTLSSATKILNTSNKSTLIQLKQQQQRPDIVLTTRTTLPQTSLTTSPQQRVSTINSTSNVRSPALNPYSRDHSEPHGGGGVDVDDHHHHNHPRAGNDLSGSSEEDNASQSTEDAGHQDEHELSGRQRPVNTFYGSGFGIFHQQRANMGGSGGGGIALITGHSGSGLGSGGSGGSYSNGINNNVNLLLGGAMLTLITTILCVVCYCCHRNIKKRTEAAYRQQRQWLENDPNMEIYSVEQCYETSGLFVGDSMDGLATIPALHHEPPPSYDAVVAMQEQQQLLMQQQQQHLLMQQLHNSSPPPGYRSSLDVSCILTARAAAAALGNPATLGLGSTDINSLAASSTNVIVATTRSPTETNDLNGNREMATGSSATSTSSHLQQQPNFLRSMKQRQRNMPTANLANFNMKKVLQAQSCCSLQRAEVENMWNAAAAALAARSTHVTNDPRGTASTSSPTLVMNQRKLSNAPSSKATTPETFGSRYLKQQNYYRRGCPLCGKFRYDNESMLSISIESDLDNVTMSEDNVAGSATNGNPAALTEYHEEAVTCGLEEGEDDECSCRHTKHRQSTRNAKTTAVVISNRNYDNEASSGDAPQQGDIELSTAIDLNANCPEAVRQCVTQTTTTTSSLSINNNANSNNNNNHEEDKEEGVYTSQPSTSAEAAAATATTAAAAATPTNTVAINLDCINENGIISLDMSKIIDKTGLPTYDAALKLESSGYV